MKKTLLAAACLAALTASPAFAAPDDDTVLTLSATAGDECVLKAFTPSGAVAAGLAGNTVTFTNIDGDTALAGAANITLTATDSYCNYPHTVVVASASGGMIDTTPTAVDAASAPFIRRIGYNVIPSWNDDYDGLELPHSVVATAVADPLARTFVSPEVDAYRGNLQVTIVVTPDPVRPVLSGTYTDTLTITIGVI